MCVSVTHFSKYDNHMLSASISNWYIEVRILMDESACRPSAIFNLKLYVCFDQVSLLSIVIPGN